MSPPPDFDPTAYSAEVRAGLHVMGAAIAGNDDEAESALAHLCVDAGTHQHRWYRMATLVHVWVGLVCVAACERGVADARAQVPAPLPDPDGGPDVALPSHVRAAAHLYNLACDGLWSEAGEVLGAAIAADEGPETTTGVLWICAQVLQQLNITAPCTHHPH